MTDEHAVFFDIRKGFPEKQGSQGVRKGREEIDRTGGKNQ